MEVLTKSGLRGWAVIELKIPEPACDAVTPYQEGPGMVNSFG